MGQDGNVQLSDIPAQEGFISGMKINIGYSSCGIGAKALSGFRI